MASDKIPITAMAQLCAGSRIATVDAAGCAKIRHALPVTPGACPRSGNPVSGTASIIYRPVGRALEAVSLFDALGWAMSGIQGAPRSVEDLARWLAVEACAAVGVPVAVRLDLLVNPGPQRIVVDHAVLSRNA
jgi:hypothetical protein